MSKYSKYGKQLDELMRQKFSDYEKKEIAYKKAKKAHEALPVREGFGVTQEYRIKALKANIAFEEAEREYKVAKAIYNESIKEAQAIRTALYNEIQSDFEVKPADLDQNVVALLTSNICTAQEVARLFENAENNTTRRYVAQYAKNKDTKNLSKEDENILKGVAHAGVNLVNPDNTVTMHNFDVAMDVVNRCVKNTAMIGHWGELTEGPLSEL